MDHNAHSTPTEQPSLLNKNTLIGALCGLAASLGLSSPLLVSLCTFAAGSIGGFIGKKEQEKKSTGYSSPPSLLNKDALLGGLIGIVAARAITLGAGSLLAAAGAPVTAIVATAVTVSMGVGVYLGGRYGKKCLETEYEQKMRSQISTMLEKSVSPELMQGIMSQGQDLLTPQEKSFVEQFRKEQSLNVPGFAPTR